MPDQPKLRSLDDYGALRDDVLNTFASSVSALPPIDSERYQLTIDNVRYDKPHAFSNAEQKSAILKNESLGWKLRGRVRLLDKQNGGVEEKDTVLAHVPWLTQRGTFIRNGSEYVVVNQSRLRPGIYTRQAASGEAEAHVNVAPGTGSMFRVQLEPDTGKLRLLYGQARIPFLPVLRALGAPPDVVRGRLGDALVQADRADDRAVSRVLERIRTDPSGTDAERLRGAFDRARLDPEVMQHTLGKPYDRPSWEALLDTAAKLVRLNRGEVEPDDRDSLAFQTIHSMDDFMRERVSRDRAGLMRSLVRKISWKGGLKALPHAALDDYVDSIFRHIGSGSRSSFATNLEEINPLEIIDQQHRLVRIGEGGIASPDAVPDESRDVNNSYLGFVDPIRTPESGKIGVDNRLAMGVLKGNDRRIYRLMRDRSGNLTPISPAAALKAVVAFPGEPSTHPNRAWAMKGGKIQLVPTAQVDYWLPNAEDMYTTSSNAVSMMSGMKGGRLLMGGKYLSQALALQDPEAPLVRSATPPGSRYGSMVEQLGETLGALRSRRPGVVTAANADQVAVKYAGDSEPTVHELYHFLPLNRKSYWHQTPRVQAGQRVNPGDLLTTSNYTDAQGNAALGKNLTIAYMPYKGRVYEDAIVISEAAAKKLTSEHMYMYSPEDESDKPVSRADFLSQYPALYGKAQVDALDKRGVVRPGVTVKKGDPLILAIGEERPGIVDALHRRVSLRNPNRSVVWDKDEPGLVTDVVPTKAGYTVSVRAFMPARVGDKLSGAHGNKGVIGTIVPDTKMPRTVDGEPIDIIVNPLGVISRGNANQKYEALLGKVAAKTGKPYVLPGFQRGSLIDFVKSELKKNGVPDTETLMDPELNTRIPDVMVGKYWFMKLHHLGESKISARSGAGDESVLYTIDRMPARGGFTGAKRLGHAENFVLAAQGAWNILKDAHRIRGAKNEDYWRAMRLGQPLPSPEPGFINQKFFEQLRAAGINTSKSGDRLHFTALTNDDVRKLSAGPLANDGTVDIRSLEPIKGGLFDLHLTGGPSGEKYSHIELTEPMPNPVFEKSIRALLGMTEKQMRDVLAGNTPMHGYTGPEALRAALERINIPEQIRSAVAEMQAPSAARRDAAAVRLGVLKMFNRTGLKPADLMWSAAPVLPPVFRPIVRIGSGLTMTSDANALYRDLMRANDALKQLKGEVSPTQLGAERLAVYDSLKAVTGLGDPVGAVSVRKELKGLLRTALGSRPKLGLFQFQMLGRPQDTAGRAVITPNPDLDLDQIGLPHKLAWQVYGPFIMRRLVREGMPPLAASTALLHRKPEAQRALTEELTQRPVLINRAPTLHRYSLQAAWPQLVNSDVIEVPPLLMPGMGADVDGDQFNVHVPVSDAAVRDAVEKMLPSRNLLSSLKFEPMFTPNQEFQHGLYVASTAKRKGKTARMFRRAADVLHAFNRGEIGYDESVEVER